MTRKKDETEKDKLNSEQNEDASSDKNTQDDMKEHILKASKKQNKEKKTEKELTALQIKYEELNDKYLRLFSDFDNYRKRSLKERIEMSKTASEELIVDLLSVIDDFERALQSLEKDNPFLEGINLIYNKFLKTLKQKGLQEIEAQGSVFDTDYHEALTNIPAPDKNQKGKVVDVIQKGYALNGKVIRYAKVVVGV